MIKIAIIGFGNLGQHLVKTLSNNSSVQLVQVYLRDPKKAPYFLPKNLIVSDFKDLVEVDLTIISVNDNSIEEVSSQIPFNNNLVVHTSGSISIDKLNSKNRKGVFYPLQTFSKSKEVNFEEIPICIEAENSEDYKILKTVADSISKSVHIINSEQRKALHVAAVFVCNFVNHLYQIGDEICTENNIPFAILKPLIQETAQKIKTLSPKDAQTGPAKRGDNQTIESHLDFLTNKNHTKIYKLLTQSILENVQKL